MNTTSLKRYLIPVALCSMLLGVPRMLFAADQNPSESDERLRRLEQRLNELVNRQEELMRRLGGPQGRQGSMPQPGPVGQAGQTPQPGMTPQPGPMMPPPGMTTQPGMVPPGSMPQPAMMPPQLGHERVLHELGGMLRLMVLVCIVCNILIAIWIYSDIRKRGEGPGIFIALALVAGIPAAIIYSLVRIADRVAVAEKRAG